MKNSELLKGEIMRNVLIILILFLYPAQQLFSQSVYESLNINTYRKYSEFNKAIEVDNFDNELLEAAIFFATNEERQKHKLPLVKYNKLLADAARLHSDDMVKYKFFDHINKKNKKHKEPKLRAAASGIKNPYIAENIIEGFILNYDGNKKLIIKEPGVFVDSDTKLNLTNRTYLELADNLVKRWMDSPGHRVNILSKDALELGCGVAFYVMKDFNNMPAVKATQNFQQFEPVNSK